MGQVTSGGRARRWLLCIGLPGLLAGGLAGLLADGAGAVPLATMGPTGDFTYRSAFWDGRHAWVVGGTDGWGRYVQRYDPTTDRLEDRTTLMYMPHSATVWTGTHAYVMGGATFSGTSGDWYYTSHMTKYHPATDTQEYLGVNAIPTTLAVAATSWDGTHGYVFGGERGNPYNPTVLDTVLRLDPATDTVTQLSVRMPAALSGAASFFDGRHAFVLGGSRADASPNLAIYRFDPATQTFQTMAAALPVPAIQAPLAWTGQHAYLMAGDRVVRYTPATDSLRVEEGVNVTPRRAGGPAVWDGTHMFVFGGQDGGTKAPTILRYTPNEPPVAAIAPPQPAECVAGRGRVALDGSPSSDPEGKPLAFAWSAPGITFEPADAARTSALFPLGSTPATLRVTDDGPLVRTATVDAVVRDTLAPATQAQASGPAGSAGWWRGPVTVALQAADQCGGPLPRASVDGAPWAPGASHAVQGDGRHAVRWFSVDPSGNAEAVRGPMAVDIDATPPRTTVVRLACDPGNAGWCRGPAVVDLAATDGLSGVVLSEASLDGGPWAPGLRHSVLADGDHALRHRSTDAAGNAEAPGTLRVPVDTRPPVTAAVPAGPRGDAGWWRGDVSVAFDARDDTSGVASTSWRVDGGAPVTGGAAPVRGQGRHVVAFASVDVAGNAEGWRQAEVPIDAVPPVTACAVDGPRGNDGWFRGAVDVALVPVDDLSGVAATRWALDGGPTQAGVSLTVAADGRHALVHGSRDVAGNEEAPRTCRLDVDATAPATGAVPEGPPGDRGWWRGPVLVRLHASDATSGVREVQARVGAGPWWRTTAISVAGDGVRAVEFRAEDVAGNAEEVRRTDVAIDGTPPRVELLAPRPGEVHVAGASAAVAPGGATVATGRVEVRAGASDATSGVDRVEFLVDGILRATAAAPPYAFAWDAGAERPGNHTVQARAVDRAGNAAVASLTVTTVPAGTAGFTAAGPLPPGWVERSSTQRFPVAWPEGAPGVPPGAVEVHAGPDPAHPNEAVVAIGAPAAGVAPVRVQVPARLPFPVDFAVAGFEPGARYEVELGWTQRHDPSATACLRVPQCVVLPFALGDPDAVLRTAPHGIVAVWLTVRDADGAVLAEHALVVPLAGQLLVPLG